MKLRILIPVFLCTYLAAHAQLRFLSGKELNVVSTNDIMYEETGIFFYTGKNKVSDYSYIFVYAKFDSAWVVSSCMNGNCQGLPDKGNFITDFGYNDTTGFIRFHVLTYGHPGVARLSYAVVNHKDETDTGTLVFNISYHSNSGLKDVTFNNGIKVFPNPSPERKYEFTSSEKISAIHIYDEWGKNISNLSEIYDEYKISIDLSKYASGVYVVKITTANGIKFVKLTSL